MIGNGSMSRILIVEDDPNQQFLMGRALEKDQHEVLMASDAIGAFALLAKMMPDLIVIDLQLPQMDGFALAHKFQDDMCLDVPLIAMSSAVTFDLPAQCERHGFTHFLAKPITIQDLRLQ